MENAPVGIPADLQPIITLVIGLLSGVLVGPLTAIAKKLGGTSGPGTVAVSGVLTLLVTFGFAVWQARTANTALPWTQTLLVALIAFVKSNGDYISRVFSSAQAEAVAKSEGK